ncbi:MAG: MBL fold metallo-hydrolase, partial [Proteobacteria bacterium]|nr:MBL fold metallo-hydrolase [Pseudomonadota bacterium]
MEITFYGATKEVTGSKHFVTINGVNIMLDYGMHQGKRSEATKLNKKIPVNPQNIDFLILSHAHIDHSGLLPLLVKKGYKNKIFTTKATKDLIDIMLRDSGHIQEMDVEYINKKKTKRGESLVEPLYTVADAENVMPLVHGVNYYEKVKLTDDISFTLFDAGHILGSAQVLLEYKENGLTKKLFFTGDLGRQN